MHILLRPAALPAVTALTQLAAELGSIVAAFAPALLQIFPKRIQPGPALPWSAFGKFRRPEKPSHGCAGDTKFSGDRSFCQTALVCRSDTLEQCLPLLSPVPALLFMPVELEWRFRYDFLDRGYALSI